MKDVLLTATKAHPAAAAANATDGLNLGPQGGAYRGSELQLYLEVPAVPALVDTKTITYTIKDSADNSSFTAIDGLATIVSTGAGGAGAAAVAKKIKLPDATRQYVRVDAAVLTAGGDNTGVSYTASIIYPGQTPAGT